MNARRRYLWNVKERSERVEANPSTAARMPFTCEAHLIYAPVNISNLYTRLLTSKMHLAAAAAYIGVMIALWIAVLQGTADHISQDKVRTSKRWPLDFSRGKPVSTPILYCGDAHAKGIYNTSSLLVEADDGLCDEVYMVLCTLIHPIPTHPVASSRRSEDWNGSSWRIALVFDLLGTRGPMKLGAALTVRPRAHQWIHRVASGCYRTTCIVSR